MEYYQSLIVCCLLGMVLLYTFWVVLSKRKAKIDFHKIKKIYKNKKTDESILKDVVKNLTSNCKESYAVEDYVDVNIGNCIFALVKGSMILSGVVSCSSGRSGGAIYPNVSVCQIFYACCLDSESLAEAKRMASLFDLIAEDGNCGIFKIKSMKKIKLRITDFDNSSEYNIKITSAKK